MRIRSIEPGDIVFCNKGGRLFHAKVIGVSSEPGAGAGARLVVKPIERNISYRQITASEITDHWRHHVTTRREDRRGDAQTSFELPPEP